MRYIVDGYNLMYVSKEHQPFRKGKKLEECRRLLNQKLAQFAAREGVGLIVVFDGRGAGGSGHQAGIEVVFSAGQGGADAEILRRVEASPNRKNITVVSSDREVARGAVRLGAQAIRSGAFMKMVESPRETPSGEAMEPPEKYNGLSAEEAEFWLGIFDDEHPR